MDADSLASAAGIAMSIIGGGKKRWIFGRGREFSPPGRTRRPLHAALTRLGLPTPTLIAGPFPNAEKEEDAVIAEVPKGRNLLFWALEGDIPHRIRAATALTIAAIDQLHGVTDGLLADPVGKTLARRPLSVDLDEIREKGGPWLSHPLFAEAIAKLTPIVAEIAEKTPLVYTNDLYFPNFPPHPGGT